MINPEQWAKLVDGEPNSFQGEYWVAQIMEYESGYSVYTNPLPTLYARLIVSNPVLPQPGLESKR